MLNNKIKQAVKILRSGGVIALPTETVFGLGAALNQPEAIKQIFKIKKRPRKKPLQVLVANLRQAKQLGKFNQKSWKFAKANWPGPTLVVKKTAKIPKLVTGGRATVGLRLPDHEIALALIKKVGPIVATSANISGRKPFLTAKQLKKGLKGVSLVLNGKVKVGQASQVIDLTKNFRLLRH